jgi:hypothetical protein
MSLELLRCETRLPQETDSLKGCSASEPLSIPSGAPLHKGVYGFR